MNNYKIKVNDEAESKEAQELFFELGYKWASCPSKKEPMYLDAPCLYISDGWIEFGDILDFSIHVDCQELTLSQLRDLVVQSKSNVREYLDPNDNYKLCLINPSDAAHWMIEVPEGTEVVRRNLQGSLNFYKKIDGHWALKNKVDMDNWYQPKPYSSHFDADDGSLPVVWKREPTQEQGLISGADVPRLIKEGKQIQYRTLPLTSINAHVWSDISLEEHEEDFTLGDFLNTRFEWRLKPSTIKLEIEIPVPFEPKVGEEYFYLNSGRESGYAMKLHDGKQMDFMAIQFGAWRTKEEIKQVVAALRGGLRDE